MQKLNSTTGCIYMHTNTITNKSYIGQTINGMMYRWRSHCRDAENMVAPNNHFHRAIRKYGNDVWEHQVLIDDVPQDLLNEYEQNMIEKYDTFNSGYNSNIGGGSAIGYKHTQEQKDKIGKAHKGKKKKPESVEKQRKALKGRVMPEDQKQKLIEAQLGVKSHHFKPWWIKYPDGSYEEHYNITKTEYAESKGWHPISFRDRFSEAKKVGSPGKKGLYKGISVGNIGEHYGE